MNRHFGLLVLAVGGVILPGVVDAQSFQDGFDSYRTGSLIAGQGGWEVRNGNPATNATVVDIQFLSAPNSLAVSGEADIVQQVSGLTDYWFTGVDTYVPSTASGELWFILLNRFDGGACTGTGCNWSVDVVMCASGCTTPGVNPGFATNFGGSEVPGSGSAPLVTDQWVEIVVAMRFYSNEYLVWYNGTLLDILPWTVTGDLTLAAVDLYSGGSTESYIDNIWLSPWIPVELQSFSGG